MKKRHSALRSALLAAACLFFSGCPEPADPRAAPIPASSPDEFAAWKNAVAQKIPAPEMQEFDSCVNEIRLGIMQRREASGADAIAWKLCGRINGKTMRETLVMGHRSTVEWVEKELALKRVDIRAHEEALKVARGDLRKTELRDFLALARDNEARLEARLEKARARLADLEAEAQKKQTP